MSNHLERNKVTPVVLCGGSGTRLWPLSRKSFPKQFIPLINGESLLSLTLKRLRSLSDSLCLVASEEHRFLLKQSLDQAFFRGDMILEPFPRNTAAAMGLASLWTSEHQSGDDLLLFCPSDHFIPDTEQFKLMVLSGIDAASSGSIVTFGVQPNSPSTAYGYIHAQGLRQVSGFEDPNISFNESNPVNISQVKRFVEKPDLNTAQRYLLSGEYLWNAGIFLTRADVLLDALKLYEPEIYQACVLSMKKAKVEQWGTLLGSESETGSLAHQFIRPCESEFIHSPSKSIDYAVMEHHPDIKVLPFSGQLSDVGSWSALSDLYPEEDHHNKIIGQGLAKYSSHTFIHAPKRRVVALGVKDLLIVDTDDALLVANRSHAEEVKELVLDLEKLSDERAFHHRKVQRPWGWFDSIDSGERFQVKRIVVNPGSSLSLQKHEHRAEHWIVVKGQALVDKGQERFYLEENQSTYIPIGEIHRLSNPGSEPLEMIEVQSGTYLGEDDIIRLEDNYGRLV
jgi:mannose-1-phosphate guanylyltransferase/mannose-6-phosphate isomerase